MACPRCGNQNIKVSKVTLLGKEPEVTFGVRNDDVVVHSYYCGKCELLEESASSEEIRRLWLRWESAPQLEQQVTWTETEDPFEPIAAVVDGHEWRLRENARPRRDRYTLIIDGVDVVSFSHWPIAWSRVSR